MDDIEELPEMTEVAEELMNWFFNDKSAIQNIRVEEDGGVKLTLQNSSNENIGSFSISGAGDKFTYENIENGEKIVLNDKNEMYKHLYDDETIIEDEQKNYVVKLSKNLGRVDIKKFCLDMNKFLSENKAKISSIEITTEEWNKDFRSFHTIPAAKKLFAKYCHFGLLAVLAINGFYEESKKMYCIAYVKAHEVSEGIKYKNLDKEDYAAKLIESMNQLFPGIPVDQILAFNKQ
jgi:hypothetical protein